MARCDGCGNRRCSCKIVAGPNVTVNGAGTDNDPLVISAEGLGEAGSRLVGEIVMYGAPAAPVGWLVCNGAAISRAVYPALFAVVSTTYGDAGDPSLFLLPDLAGRIPMGADISHPLGTMAGVETHTLTVANIPQHAHTITHTHDVQHYHGASSDAQNEHSHTGPNHTHEAGSLRTPITIHAPIEFLFNQYNVYAATGGFNAVSGWNLGVNQIVGDTAAAGTGSTGSVGAHAHNISVGWSTAPTSGGASPGTSGNYGTASPSSISNMQPWTGVTFIIKT